MYNIQLIAMIQNSYVNSKEESVFEFLESYLVFIEL